MTRWVDPTSQVTTWSRNNAGAPTRRQLPGGRVTKYAYDGKGNLTQVQDSLSGATWTYTYGSTFANLLTATSPTGEVATLEYDGAGNPNHLIVSDSSQRWAIEYNGRGQPRAVEVWSFTGKNFEAFNTTVYDTTATWNPVLTSTLRAAFTADTVRLTYDAAGRVKDVIDHKGGTVTFAYNAMNRVTSRTDQLNNAESWVYSAAGMDSVWTNRRGQSVTYLFDALGRLSSKIAEVTTQFQYDAESSLTRAWNSESDVKWFYDSLGRDTATTQLVNGFTKRVSYTYRPGLWQRSTMRDPDGGVHSYAYDVDDRLATITDPNSYATTYGYDATGRVFSREQGNGQLTTYGFSGSVLDSIRVRIGSTTIWSVDREYDQFGYPKKWTFQDGSHFTFLHDNKGQLTQAVLRDASNNVLTATTTASTTTAWATASRARRDATLGATRAAPIRPPDGAPSVTPPPRHPLHQGQPWTKHANMSILIRWTSLT